MTKTAVKSAKRVGVRMVQLEDLIPNPLNANSMSAELQEKLKAHIRRTGLTPYLIARPHSDQPGKFELLDGHHRAAILRELGYREAECDIWDVTDKEARLLLATLNRLAGQDIPERRAEIVHQLLGEMGLSDLSDLLPESEKQLEELHSLLEFPAEEIAAMLDEEAQQAEKVLPRVMSFVVTPEQEQLIEQAVEMASDGTPGRDRKARGLTNLARHFLEARSHAESSR